MRLIHRHRIKVSVINGTTMAAVRDAHIHHPLGGTHIQRIKQVTNCCHCVAA